MQVGSRQRPKAIFISYRNEDAGHVGRLQDRLLHKFPADVFRDRVDIDYGKPWPFVLEDALARCKLLIVVITPAWRRDITRLKDENDWVRREIEVALQRQIPIFTVYAGGVPPLTDEDLRESGLQALLDRQAQSLEYSGDLYDAGFNMLVEAIERKLERVAMVAEHNLRLLEVQHRAELRNVERHEELLDSAVASAKTALDNVAKATHRSEDLVRARKPRVFISYVRDDQDVVGRLVQELSAYGVDIWLDKTSLQPGHRWRDEIRKAISEGDFFIACFSERYQKRSKSYMNEELTLAIEELRQRPTDRAWFIPVLLSQCEVPARNIGSGETLRDIHWVELYQDWEQGIDKIATLIVPDATITPR